MEDSRYPCPPLEINNEAIPVASMEAVLAETKPSRYNGALCRNYIVAGILAFCVDGRAFWKTAVDQQWETI